MSLKSLLLRNFIFTLLQPGVVAGLIPYLIIKNYQASAFAAPLQFHHYSGIVIALAGLLILFSCIFRFAVEGLGTLSPADPTKKMVINGLYRFSRNPMYIGVVMILTGEAIFTQSVYLGIYMILISILFSLFIIYFEEPRLKKEFGEQYEEYCERVRRWF